MRYTEQLKYSLIYHWGVFHDCWDMLTGKLHWWIVGLLVVLCVVPVIVLAVTPSSVFYSVESPAPLFDTDCYWLVTEKPPTLLLFNYYWVNGSGFMPLSNVLCLVSMGVLLGAYLREEDSVRGREE